MGREIKHVPLDFDHPLKEVWPGYINEHWKECPACKGRGTTNAMEYLAEVTRTLVWHIDQLKGQDHQDIIELTTGLCGRSPSGGLFGHDSLDEMKARYAIVKAAGLDEDWGECPVCNGEGDDPECHEAYTAWEKTEPPSGDGLQVWETVSEGSPVSPVFANEDTLVQWLVGEGYSEPAARSFATHEWAPTGTYDGSHYYKDIESCAHS